jgi:hypothetical protein
MTFDKLPSLSSLTRTGSVLSALVIAAFLFAGSLTAVQQTAATTVLTDAEQNILDTQDAATENLSESDRDVNGIEFTPRWGGISRIGPNDQAVLFADCQDDEFAVSSMSMFQSSDIIEYNSFPVAYPNDRMSWLSVVTNTNDNEERSASIGVICADENDGDDDDDVNISTTTKTIIQNTVNNFVQVVNNQVVNLQNVVVMQQAITQNAYNIAYITGNNNTVNQVIQQSANNILNANTTNTVEVDQIIEQTATNEGVISGGTTLDQAIGQNATNQADVTDADDTAIDQAIGQNATNQADVTDADDTAIDQAIAQGAGNTANVGEDEED